MKKILLAFFILISVYSFAQNDTTKYFNSVDYGWRYNRVKAKLALVIPVDTVANKLVGSVVILNDVFYIKTATAWVQVSGSSLSTLTLGSGLLGTSYNGSSAVTAKVDTSTISTKANVVASLLGYATAANLALKLNISDTASMLSTHPNTTLVNSLNALKVNISDTATMLTPYIRTQNYGTVKTGQGIGVDTSAISTKANVTALLTGYASGASVVKYTDTATMLSPYSRDFNVVHKTGNETIAGVKTFSSDAIINTLNVGLGNSSVSSNSVFGVSAGSAISTGANNFYGGYFSGKLNTTGGSNTYLGAFSGANGATGSNNNNTYVGMATGYSVGAASANNIMIGYYAGRYITGGVTEQTLSNSSIFIGDNTKALADNQNNQIIIGSSAVGLGTNTTTIGNSSTAQTALRGRLTLGSTVDDGSNQLQVTGSSKFTGNVVSTGVGSFGSIAQVLTSGGEAIYGTVGSLGSIYLQGGTISIGSQKNIVVQGASVLGNTLYNINLTGTHSSGSSGIQTDLLINPTINFTALTYTVRGIYYNPTMTALFGNSHIALETTIGNNLLGTTSGETVIGSSTTSGAKLTVNGSVTAASAIARGQYNNNTLVAAANSDFLVGIDVNPTFTNGAFTGVGNYAARFQSNVLIGTVAHNGVPKLDVTGKGYFTDTLQAGTIARIGGTSAQYLMADGSVTTSAGGGTTTNALTMNNSGTGAASGTTFNGSAAQTISYNTIGAQQALTLTTTGTSGAATLVAGTLNIPQYSGGGMVYPAAGIAVSTGSAWTTSITDNSANWNTAYTNRITSLTTTGSSGAATLVSNVLNIPTVTLAGLSGQPQLSGTGFVKASGTTISYDNSTYLTTTTAGTTYVPYSGATGAISLNTQTLASGAITSSGIIASTASTTGSSSQGAIAYGTLSYADVNHLLTLQTSQNSYAQMEIQNTNAGASASSDVIVGNNNTTSTTFYGNFGMNSSGWVGSGAFNTANTVYVSATSGDLALGTTTSNPIHFVVNGGATDALTIATTGAATFASSVTASSIVKSGGTSAQYLMADGSVTTSAGGGTTTNALTFATSGGAAAGSTFDGSVARTISASSVGALPLAGGTMTGALTLAATSTSVTPLTFTTGGLPNTTPVAGGLQLDGSGFLNYTHVGGISEVGVVEATQMTSLTSAYTLTSQTAAQKAFNASTNGQLTVAGSTTYYFEGLISLSSMSATSGSFGFALGGTATLTSVQWHSSAVKAGTLTTATAPQMTFNTTAANTTVATASTATTGYMFVKGIVRVNASGTLIPQVSLGVAAAAVVGVNSYFKLIPVGAGITTNIGPWN